MRLQANLSLGSPVVWRQSIWRYVVYWKRFFNSVNPRIINLPVLCLGRLWLNTNLHSDKGKKQQHRVPFVGKKVICEVLYSQIITKDCTAICGNCLMSVQFSWKARAQSEPGLTIRAMPSNSDRYTLCTSVLPKSPPLDCNCNLKTENSKTSSTLTVNS